LRDGSGRGGVGGRLKSEFQTFEWFQLFQSWGTGAAMEGKDESFKDFVLDQLAGLDDIEGRRMFGGFGLYQDETFFGIVHQGKVFFKIDDSTIGEYRQRKMKPFRPNAKQTLKSYYQVPVDVIEDRDQLRRWAMRAIACQEKKR
jgi:DNA transformation protein